MHRSAAGGWLLHHSTFLGTGPNLLVQGLRSSNDRGNQYDRSGEKTVGFISGAPFLTANVNISQGILLRLLFVLLVRASYGRTITLSRNRNC